MHDVLSRGISMVRKPRQDSGCFSKWQYPESRACRVTNQQISNLQVSTKTHALNAPLLWQRVIIMRNRVFWSVGRYPWIENHLSRVFVVDRTKQTNKESRSSWLIASR